MKEGGGPADIIMTERRMMLHVCGKSIPTERFVNRHRKTCRVQAVEYYSIPCRIEIVIEAPVDHREEKYESNELAMVEPIPELAEKYGAILAQMLSTVLVIIPHQPSRQNNHPDERHSLLHVKINMPL